MSIDLIAQPSFLLELGGKKGAEVSISKKAYTYACPPDCTFATLHRLGNFPSFSRLVEVEGDLEILPSSGPAQLPSQLSVIEVGWFKEIFKKNFPIGIQ